ncbi:MAG: VWA domain-containing protein, partial [Desulfuromusa sp.]|nr:VWA domain-containing protein [Desulfuromusa sp.]
MSTNGKYIPKVDNFLVILDTSLSMDENGKNDFLIARDLVSQINQGIPSDLNFNAGLRSIGHSSYQSENPTDLLYGMSGYDRSAFHQGLAKIKYTGGSPTPMAAGLAAAGNDLKSAAGKSAIIIVS